MHLLPMQDVGPRVGRQPIRAHVPTGPAEHFPQACTPTTEVARKTATIDKRTIVTADQNRYALELPRGLHV